MTDGLRSFPGLHEVLGDGNHPEDDHRQMMGIYLIDILGFRVSVISSQIRSTVLIGIYL